MADAAPRAYPLQWPAGWPRTPWNKRTDAKFSAQERKHRDGQSWTVHRDLTIAEAMERLEAELERLGARLPVLSSNLETRLSGGPKSGQRNPDDPGVAVYFTLKGRATVMPCDRFTTAAGNIAAIAAHIGAVRAIERYGVGTVEQMFTGFQAIRGPGPKPWREVLGFRPDERLTADDIKAKQRALARSHHPDVGGSDAAMAEINSSAATALAEIAADA